MLIPIGAWCRTAYQVGNFIEKHKAQNKSYPFDWTITPFFSLQKILNPLFNPTDILVENNLKLSKFSSIADAPSSLIFHHDLSENVVADHLKRGPTNPAGVPITLLRETTRVQDARARFIHTYSNLNASIEQARSKGERIGFVRWMRGGHPDYTLPEAFEGETTDTLWQLLSSFCNTSEVAVLHVISKTNKNTEISGEECLTSFCSSARGAVATICERRGWNGDGSNSYRGDTTPWEMALTRFTTEFSIPIASN